MKAIILKFVQYVWYFISSPYYVVRSLVLPKKYPLNTFSEESIENTNVVLSDEERIMAAGIKSYSTAIDLIRRCGYSYIEDVEKMSFTMFSQGKKIATVRAAFPVIAGLEAPIFVTGLIPKSGEERDKLRFVAPGTWTCYDPTLLTRLAGNKHYVQLYEMEA